MNPRRPVSAKPTGGKVPGNPRVRQLGDELVQAAMHHRVVDMLYHSASHRRKQRFIVHCLREDATVSPAFFDLSTQGRLPFNS